MESSSLSEDECSSAASKRKQTVRFSAAQKTCLEAYYCQGMTRTAKEDSHVISNAARDTNLTTAQVKVSNA